MLPDSQYPTFLDLGISDLQITFSIFTYIIFRTIWNPHSVFVLRQPTVPPGQSFS